MFDIDGIPISIPAGISVTASLTRTKAGTTIVRVKTTVAAPVAPPTPAPAPPVVPTPSPNPRLFSEPTPNVARGGSLSGEIASGGASGKYKVQKIAMLGKHLDTANRVIAYLEKAEGNWVEFMRLACDNGYNLYEQPQTLNRFCGILNYLFDRNLIERSGKYIRFVLSQSDNTL